MGIDVPVLAPVRRASIANLEGQSLQFIEHERREVSRVRRRTSVESLDHFPEVAMQVLVLPAFPRLALPCVDSASSASVAGGTRVVAERGDQLRRGPIRTLRQTSTPIRRSKRRYEQYEVAGGEAPGEFLRESSGRGRTSRETSGRLRLPPNSEGPPGIVPAPRDIPPPASSRAPRPPGRLSRADP